MARINLLTRHSGESYGAVLQTYATCKILQSLGHTVTIINLIGKRRKKRDVSLQSLKACPKWINFWFFKLKNYPSRTKVMKTIDRRLIPDADYTIVGSDQVWHALITKENKLSYFLDFADNTKKLSLASSFGKQQWTEDEEYTKKVRECLSAFSAISVRETTGVDICRDTFGVKATCIIDPTIAWGRYENFINKKPRKQIACFILNGDNTLCYNVVDRLIVATGMKAKMLDYYSGPKYQYLNSFEKSPVKWLNEIFNSEIVVTDSFHGVAFSLVFKKQFFVVLTNVKQFERISSLLRKVGLENRVITSMEDFNKRQSYLLSPIDYQYAQKVLEEEQRSYYSFAKNNIHE